jgi:hypothetical protein
VLAQHLWMTELTDARLEKAFHRSGGYFELGKYYEGWFDDFELFLTVLGCTFASGEAHPDCVSPFATMKGISGCKKTEALVAERGFKYCVRTIELCPRAKLILARGVPRREMPTEWRALLPLSEDRKSEPHEIGRGCSQRDLTR